MSKNLMHIFFVSLFCLTACSQSTSEPRIEQSTNAATEPVDWQRTLADIDQLTEFYNAPSVSVSVVLNGEVIHAYATGLSDIGEETRASINTQYAIGSIVKSFTSGLIGDLSNDGLLTIDGSPADYVDGLEFNSADLTENLRISNLLSQTSGLPFMDGTLAFFPESDQADLVPRLARFDASCRVGDCWAYNNLNFVLLDIVAESVTGQSKSELLRERLLRPAGMSNTLASTTEFLASPDAATGYGMVAGSAHPTAVEYLYDEHIYTTASDLGRWLSIWMTGGSDVLPEAYVREATSLQAIENGAPPTSESSGTYMFGYGYGWQTQSLEGHYVVRHGGNENGFTAHVAFVPASGLGVVTLTNQQNTILPNVINDMLLRRFLGLPETPIASYPVIVNEITAAITAEEARLKILPDAPMTLSLADIQGAYAAEGYGTIDVRIENETLFLRTPAAEFVLVHRDGNTFSMASTDPVPAGIVIDFFEVKFSQGSLSMNIASDPVEFSKRSL